MIEHLSHDTNLWVAISFAVFLLIAFKLGRKSILGSLDNRIAEIKTEIETAKRLRTEAQELLEQYQHKQYAAEEEAKEIINRAKNQAESLASTSQAEIESTIQRKEQQLVDRLNRMEKNAIAEIQNYAAEMAVSATTEIISRALDAKVNTDLNNSTISNLSKNLN